MWSVFLDKNELEGFHRSDHGFAMIAAEVRRTNVKDPKSVKVSDFLPRFKRVQLKPESVSPRDRKKALKNSKAFWLGGLGLTQEGKKNDGDKSPPRRDGRKAHRRRHRVP